MRTGLLFTLCVILNEVTSQTLDSVTTLSAPVTIQNLESKSPSSNSKWDELMPALQMIKNTSNIKKGKLLNLVKIIKFLLSEELENNESETTKVLEENKETEDVIPARVTPDIDRIVEEDQKSIKGVIDDKSYILVDKAKVNNETTTAKNKTADLSRILSKITTALTKLKEQNLSSETQTPSAMIPIFRSSNNFQNDFEPPPFENSRQLRSSASSQHEINPMSSLSMFNIPCQRASDILEETATFPLPKEAFCDNPAVNLKSLAKNTKLNLDNLPFSNIVPNSISCVDSDDSIAVLFKPKTISLMQLYGKLLKEVTITVLVPYYVTKLAL